MANFGMLAGGAAEGFVSGLDAGNRYRTTNSNLKTAEQARAESAAEERRRGIKFGNEQEDRADVTKSLEEKAAAMGAEASPSIPPGDVPTLGVPTSGATGASAAPGKTGTGITTAPPASGKGTANTPGTRGGLSAPTMDVATAKRLFMQRPSRANHAQLVAAQAEEVARLEFDMKARESDAKVDYTRAGAANVRANTEQTKVQTERNRLSLSQEELEAGRKVVMARSELAAAQAQMLDPGRGLNEGENKGRSGPIVANLVDAMNVGQKALGFTTEAAVDPETGDYVLTTYAKDNKGVRKRVGEQVVGTVKDLNKLIAIGGISSNSEYWGRYNASVIGVQQVQKLRDIASMQTDIDADTADMKSRMTKTQLAQAGPAADEADAYYKDLREKPLSWILDNYDNLVARAEKIKEMVPPMFEDKFKTETEDALGNKTKGEVTRNRLLEHLKGIVPPLTKEHYNQNGQKETVSFPAAAERMATIKWKDTVKATQDMFNLPRGVQPDAAQIQQYVASELTSFGASERLVKYLVQKVTDTRTKIDQMGLESAVSPAVELGARNQGAQPGGWADRAGAVLGVPQPKAPPAQQPPAKAGGGSPLDYVDQFLGRKQIDYGNKNWEVDEQGRMVRKQDAPKGLWLP